MISPQLQKPTIPKNPKLSSSGASSSSPDLIVSKNYVAFDQFASPLEMLYVIDENFINGKISLYPWQKHALVLIAQDYNAEAPLKYVIPAVNGSGKDYIVIAATAMWLTLRKIRHLTVITSASGNQLSSQTETYIRNLASKANDTLLQNMFKVNQRNITCSATGSQVRLFATDEPGKAEGYHPMDFGAEMCIIPNEAKSIPEDIFKALNRCTGFSRWIEVSSPGKPAGHFYNIAKMAKDLKSFKSIREASTYQGGWIKSVITVDDCPHISRSQMQEDFILYGEHSSYCRSKYRAEFTTEDELVVIEFDKLVDCYENPPAENLTFAPLRAGMDLGFGGDKSELSVWEGNKQIGIESWRIKDTVQQVEFIIELLATKYPLLKAENVNTDDGNAGKAVIDMLHNKGFLVNRVLNQSIPINRKAYANRGAEMYFSLAALINQKLLVFIQDETQRDQLSFRHWKQSAMNGKIVLRSKADEKALGISSPDRGDACVLANKGLQPQMMGGFGSDRLAKDLKNNKKSILNQGTTSSNKLVAMMERRQNATWEALQDEHDRKHSSESSSKRRATGLCVSNARRIFDY